MSSTTISRARSRLPFDLLYWNSDATRMPAANHSFYLRNCYLENRLTKGEMVIGGKQLDLKSVKVPIYNLATREDHIAPAKSVLLGSKFFGGPVRFVLAGSGPHRRRGQSARQDEIPVLDRTQADQRQPRYAGCKGQGACRLVVAGLVRVDQSAGPRPRCRRASPAAASSRRSRTRREAMSRSGTD